MNKPAADPWDLTDEIGNVDPIEPGLGHEEVNLRTESRNRLYYFEGFLPSNQ